jgi:hypothetical protein
VLPKDHPALGAFKRKRRLKIEKVDWESLADELAYGLKRHIGHHDECQCRDHLALRVYDEAVRRSRPGG